MFVYDLHKKIRSKSVSGSGFWQTDSTGSIKYCYWPKSCIQEIKFCDYNMDKVAIELGVFFLKLFNSNLYGALVRFWDDAHDFRSNCVALNSVAIVNHTGSQTSQLQVEIVYG